MYIIYFLQKSGLNDWIASILGWLEEIPIVLLILFVFFMLSLFTEVLAVSTINGIFSWILGDIVSDLCFIYNLVTRWLLLL